MDQQNRCSFCGRTSSDVAVLLRGREGCICDKCIEVARLVLGQRVSDRSLVRDLGGIDVSPYKVDTRTAELFGVAQIRSLRCVPLALYEDSITFAVASADLSGAPRIVEELKKHTRSLPMRGEVEVCILPASQESLERKLEELVRLLGASPESAD